MSKQYVKEFGNYGKNIGYISEDTNGSKSYFNYKTNKVEYKEDRYGTLRDRKGNKVSSVNWDL